LAAETTTGHFTHFTLLYASVEDESKTDTHALNRPFF
jgi:hypothetical protein